MESLILTRRTGATPGCPAALAAGVAVAVLAVAGDGVVAIALALVAATAAAVVDVRERRIPDALVALSFVAVVMHAAALGLDGRSGIWAGVLVGLALFAGPILIVHLVAPAAMGFGDVKLAAALGATCGIVGGSLSIVALTLASGGTAAYGLVRRRSEVPFAPGLVAGATAALAIGVAAGMELPRWR